ncbi:MAG: apolipoprotein N-acyltransferase [Pseudomonadota bacterium]
MPQRGAAAALAPLGCGVVLGSGHAPYDLPYVAILALPVLFRIWHARQTAGTAFLAGWWAGLGYFGLTLTWIVEPFFVDAARHGVFAPFALIAMAGGLAVFWGAAFALARRLGAHGWRAALTLAGALVLAEYARSHVLTGFPWALIAYVWVDAFIGQAAAWFGPHGLSLLVYSAGFLCGVARPAAIGAGLSLLAVLAAGGAARLPVGEPAAADGPVIRLVQPNAPQSEKWKPDRMPVFYGRHLAATAAPGAPDAVIWSETAVPFLLDARPERQAEIATAAGGAPVILGIQRRDAAGRWFNSLAALGPAGETAAVYDKAHLVPFGEYMPFAGLLRRAGLTYLADGLVGSFAAGTGPAAVQVAELPPFQPLICYEAIFPHRILTGAQRPAWLVQVTNDAWFGAFSGPYQHLAQARMRAIEQGLPVARAANTGISAMIDPFGRVSVAIPLDEAGHRDAVLPPPLRATLYARSGDMPAILVALALLGLAPLGARCQTA